MRSTAQNIDELRLLIDGRTTLVTPANADTILFSLDGHRCAITSRVQDRLIELTTVAPDEDELNDAAMARVLEAAGRPKTPRAERPSVLQKAVRTAARQYHEATWNHGYSEGQSRFAALPLSQRVFERDVDELVRLAMGAVLADPALRAEFVAAAEAASLEDAFAAQLAEH
ncbi:hypothetical protein ACTXG6_06055 [Pseudonocardia sp. Cha107L01]|uniref:hypothetical protein n=1 Tax=Pseudonocardia sp. Cha107L01 TaxID=3457576 RepID=UPI00403E4AAA